MASETVSALGEGFLSYSSAAARDLALRMEPTVLCQRLHELFGAHAEALDQVVRLLGMAREKLPKNTDCDQADALLWAANTALEKFDEWTVEIAGACEAAVLRLDTQAQRAAEVAHA